MHASLLTQTPWGRGHFGRDFLQGSGLPQLGLRHGGPLEIRQFRDRLRINLILRHYFAILAR